MKILKKFKYAIVGLMDGLSQASIRLQLFLGLIAIITFGLLKISFVEWLAVIAMIALVVLCEWINSIVELTVDYISLEDNPQAKRIKDFSAALVLLAGLFAFCVGVMLLGKYLL